MKKKANIMGEKQKRKTINLYEYITKFNYKEFIKKQIIYSLNPIKHFKEEILKNKD